MKTLAPGATIGIVGGGQLGRMLAMAAHELGFKTHIFCPDTNTPATQIATTHTHAAYDDATALAQFANQVNVITYEFENIPITALQALDFPIMPPLRALQVAQDRWHEKNFIQAQGIAIAAFHAIDKPSDIPEALSTLGGTGILKTRRFGYDGKGQWQLTTHDTPPPIDMAQRPCILEAFVPFDKEISVLVARGQDGGIALYNPIENTHKNHILHQSHLPATISQALAAQAQSIASTLASALDYVGILAVEFFVQGDTLLVNEIAPRVHNSGHLTQDACMCGQFEQHIRAIAGWRLGDTTAHHNAVMTNLIGDDVHEWQTSTPEPNCHLHLYGKAEAQVGRKMGHITRLMNR